MEPSVLLTALVRGRRWRTIRRGTRTSHQLSKFPLVTAAVDEHASAAMAGATKPTKETPFIAAFEQAVLVSNDHEYEKVTALVREGPAIASIVQVPVSDGISG